MFVFKAHMMASKQCHKIIFFHCTFQAQSHFQSLRLNFFRLDDRSPGTGNQLGSRQQTDHSNDEKNDKLFSAGMGRHYWLAFCWNFDTPRPAKEILCRACVEKGASNGTRTLARLEGKCGNSERQSPTYYIQEEEEEEEEEEEDEEVNRTKAVNDT
jgi:hypothetical protein